ncbi:hypothetical protein RHGRI_016859 [Rhododendron griersonianum]|uniref:Uncharacterized protein n=1 Tax=Rhododendron griersonianum TaxID=479676 RepID=A0AAV6JVV0_9ERIC|nr:hypothetical protein RHGRI_016859 [Rhododendron griersonianum]
MILEGRTNLEEQTHGEEKTTSSSSSFISTTNGNHFHLRTSTTGEIQMCMSTYNFFDKVYVQFIRVLLYSTSGSGTTSSRKCSLETWLLGLYSNPQNLAVFSSSCAINLENSS